ncbi:hypothetical protein ELQ35_01180 [Peribacillus cavernae]|uniref:Competence protein n=1 Tax=Peribacillus cavernae TaxID=1674310 RepID=A0A3S0VQL9_9BACI|nr:competence protein ComK [Peribacillus cavernae]MDQ0218115.1 competence protein ComK [Peribacillus cavernae]RUQ32730.1 hypothetical protein ELQ35_01180 [Peribacillus cavernae]
MKVQEKYLINLESSMLTSEYDSFGNQNTRLLEGVRSLLIDEKPLTIINDSILFYGSNLKGAIKGAKSIIGNHNMSPIAVHSAQNIIWFPCKGIDHADCIWFAYHNIENILKIDAYTSMVILKHGHRVVLDMKFHLLKRRVSIAGQLYIQLKNRNSGTFTYFVDSNGGFHVCKETGHNYYTFRKRGE